MTQWEYKTLVIELKTSFWGSVDFPQQELEPRLNDLGRDGWELVSAETSTVYQGQSNRLLMVFKRPRP
jgi:hypothetical protein